MEAEADGKVLFSLDHLWSGPVPRTGNVPTLARDAVQVVKVRLGWLQSPGFSLLVLVSSLQFPVSFLLLLLLLCPAPPLH